MTTAYLTVDDAPSATLPEKLAVLDDYGVRALFFCEGRRLADHADNARQAVEAGHPLGNHAHDHNHASEIPVEDFADEVDRTETAIDEVYADAGVERPAKLFRFPFGDKGGDRAAEFQAVLAERGFRPPNADLIEYDFWTDQAGDRDWFWTVDVEDYNVDTKAGLAENVADAADRLESDSRDILLFHDGGNSPEQFEHYLKLLDERGVEFGDPLELVEGVESAGD
ncbi:polysaccharide deacetylase family protein [Halosimplex pelagicum]|uniref:Polysaccharide deacetylase family protein n=1 Tax=Halosimplex pelagicum TaxID=869886 RepID=A0A7D5P7V1_9EURY|nr:polysaccharide deacetylase family protein [Halosimplex pelagicum]QLH83057.1 polysaccharide deacetylase family protein [Halosimplex pelagicum]